MPQKISEDDTNGSGFFLMFCMLVAMALSLVVVKEGFVGEQPEPEFIIKTFTPIER